MNVFIINKKLKFNVTDATLRHHRCSISLLVSGIL